MYRCMRAIKGQIFQDILLPAPMHCLSSILLERRCGKRMTNGMKHGDCWGESPGLITSTCTHRTTMGNGFVMSSLMTCSDGRPFLNIIGMMFKTWNSSRRAKITTTRRSGGSLGMASDRETWGMIGRSLQIRKIVIQSSECWIIWTDRNDRIYLNHLRSVGRRDGVDRNCFWITWIAGKRIER